ncbi:hypothetical protein [Dongia sp.]|uniref:hypothetical protein n=1 Tax=Dongia sp. TaxID=1977262 RepID=UPI003752750A
MMTRRHLLAGAALLALPSRQALAGEVAATEALLALLPDRNAAAPLGATWIQQKPQQPGAVLQSLQQRLGIADARKMRDAIAEDFRNGAIVKIEGWQIARTQAELCALAYFAKSGGL